jgi:hypothetical protein
MTAARNRIESEATRALKRSDPTARPVDVDNELAGVVVGHRLAGGEVEEIDLDLVRGVIAGEITDDQAIENIKREMGFTAGPAAGHRRHA